MAVHHIAIHKGRYLLASHYRAVFSPELEGLGSGELPQGWLG